MPYLKPDDFRKVQDALFESASQPTRMIAQGIMTAAADAVASPGLRELANDLYGDDETEIDDEGAGTSPTDEGTWVQAWVWVSVPQMVESGLIDDPDADAPECEHCGEARTSNPCEHCNGFNEGTEA